MNTACWKREVPDSRYSETIEPVSSAGAARAWRAVKSRKRTRGAAHLKQRLDRVENSQYADRITGMHQMEPNGFDSHVLENQILYEIMVDCEYAIPEFRPVSELG
jgi:hypothetical protein